MNDWSASEKHSRRAASRYNVPITKNACGTQTHMKSAEGLSAVLSPDVGTRATTLHDTSARSPSPVVDPARVAAGIEKRGSSASGWKARARDPITPQRRAPRENNPTPASVSSPPTVLTRRSVENNLNGNTNSALVPRLHSARSG